MQLYDEKMNRVEVLRSYIASTETLFHEVAVPPLLAFIKRHHRNQTPLSSSDVRRDRAHFSSDILPMTPPSHTAPLLHMKVLDYLGCATLMPSYLRNFKLLKKKKQKSPRALWRFLEIRSLFFLSLLGGSDSVSMP